LVSLGQIPPTFKEKTGSTGTTVETHLSVFSLGSGEEKRNGKEHLSVTNITLGCLKKKESVRKKRREKILGSCEDQPSYK